VATALTAPRGAAAQRVDGARAAVSPRPSEQRDRSGAPSEMDWPKPPADSAGSASQPNRAPLRVSARIRSFAPLAPLASAIAPGAGQFVLGDDRFIAYAAVELLGWLKYAKDSREQAAQEATFRDLARKVARVAYGPNPPDGNWTYYEAMRDWKSSGQFTTATDGSVVPTTDTSTYNGHQWRLAQQTTPDAASALAQYERTAYKSDHEWSWDNAQVQWDIFKRTTFKRDDAHYAGLQDLIVIGANHFLSMVDAFVTFRLSVHTDDAGRATVGASVRW
jgi:hypothetical protein